MQIIEKKIMDLTPAKAQEFLTYNILPSQRRHLEERKDNLVAIINAGLFMNADIAIATNGHGKTYLINGQHCCSAVIKLQKPIKVTLIKCSCADDEDLSLAYRQFDTGYETRSIPEILNVERDSLKRNWKRFIAPLIVAAVIIIEYGINPSKIKFGINRNTRVILLKKYLKYADLLDDFIECGKNKIFQRAAVVAVFIQTHEKHPHIAPIFWDEVKDGAGLPKDSPQLKLRDYLLTTPSWNKSTSREMQVKCIHAWNAVRKNERTKLTYYADAPIPKIL